jgi:hypothetical protein
MSIIMLSVTYAQCCHEVHFAECYCDQLGQHSVKLLCPNAYNLV